MLKIEARATETNKQKEVGFDSQDYPQKLWIEIFKAENLEKRKNYKQKKLIRC